MNARQEPGAPAIERTQLSLQAKDGFKLSGYRYKSVGSPKGNLIMAGATGVAQRFYRRFADFAAGEGFNVLTLDYRGIGESKPGSLKGFEMSYLDWGFLDLAAMVDLISDEDLPIYWVGHSFGGHAIGLLPNHEKLAAAYTFGSGAGWAGWMSRGESLKVKFLWNFVLPVIVKWKGYMAWSLLGMGDDLPLGVYKDWKRWCAYPYYYFEAPEMAHLASLYARVRTPCVFATAVDDRWAPPLSRNAFVRAFQNAPLLRRDIRTTPELPEIGHMGYFRANAQPLWSEVLQWLTSQPVGARTNSGAAA